MSVDQYQRAVNGLDKEIADLEKKKAAKDKDIASYRIKLFRYKNLLTRILHKVLLIARENRLLLVNQI